MSENRTSWTPERDRTLLMLWRLGFRPTQIMVMLGGVTRNGVLGRYVCLQPYQPRFGFFLGNKLIYDEAPAPNSAAHGGGRGGTARSPD